MRITAVSYLNTIPFIYGIEKRVAQIPVCSLHEAEDGGRMPSVVDGIALSLRIPTLCAADALDGRADIVLVPVAAIPLIPGFDVNEAFAADSTIETGDALEPNSISNSDSKSGDLSHFKPQIITNYCIGAEGAVDTVVLLSDTPLKEITTIYLDSHSRTSVQLVQVLAREHWGISPEWVDVSVCESLDGGRDRLDGKYSSLAHGEAVMAIGDKVFGLTAEHVYAHRYDLAAEWSVFTGGLPFVFAAWVACTPVGLNFTPQINEMLAYGVGHIEESITERVDGSLEIDFDSAYHYLTECVKFNLDEPKRAAIRLFWEKTITPD